MVERIGTGPPPMPRAIKAALVVLAILAVGLGYVGYRSLAAAAPSNCVTKLGTEDGSKPDQAIARFLVWAAARQAPGRAYDAPVVTPHLAHGASRADWYRGSIPVPYIPRPRLVDTKLRTNQPRVIELALLLESSEPGSAGPYRIILTRTCTGPWLVNYFAPATLYGAPAA